MSLPSPSPVWALWRESRIVTTYSATSSARANARDFAEREVTEHFAGIARITPP